MIKNILIIILLAIGVSCYSQTQTSRVVVSMVDGGDNIVFTHKDSSKTIVPDHSVGVIYRVANSIAINVTVKSEGETDRIIALDYRYILSPTFASTKSLIDTISAWTSSANSLLPSTSYVDTAIVRRMDTIIDRLSVEQTQDTLKSLVFTAVAKVRTDRDTLFNCKSISFGRKSTASGTLVLTYENGESESFNVANDDLPAWVNGEFISYLDYDATGAVGLIVNTLGCSQTDTEICAKVKPIFDCDLVIPITCSGWQSNSGVWQSASGCWNTGQ